jgi:hypothetical protein
MARQHVNFTPQTLAKLEFPRRLSGPLHTRDEHRVT